MSVRVDPGLERVAGIVAGATGITPRSIGAPALRAALARVTGVPDPRAFLALADDPGTGPGIVARLIDEVTVKETYFFRDRTQLEAIPWRALAARAGVPRRPLRVWSAACATGEEAYTLVLVADAALGIAAPPTTVLGTDVSRAALAAAGAGRYRARAVAPLPPPLRARHLVADGRGLRVREGLRARVRLRHHNLAAEGGPPAGEGPFDVIVCRNVLIYFDEETAARVVARLQAALVPGGVLVLGAADALPVARGRLARSRGAAPAPPVRSKASSPRPAAERPPAPAAGAPAQPDAGPLDPDAWLARGLAEMGAGDAAAAAASFRRALFLRPRFPLAAFQLGRAHDGAGDHPAARRAYGQALRALALGEGDEGCGPIGAADLAGACRARLLALAGVPARLRREPAEER